MAQRLLIAACLAAVAACCATVGVVWSQSTRAAAQAAEANHRLAEAAHPDPGHQSGDAQAVAGDGEAGAAAKSQEWIPHVQVDGREARWAACGRIRGHDSGQAMAARSKAEPSTAYRMRRDWPISGSSSRETGSISSRPATVWKLTGSLNAVPGTSGRQVDRLSQGPHRNGVAGPLPRRLASSPRGQGPHRDRPVRAHGRRL